jgi:hypothetical protein
MILEQFPAIRALATEQKLMLLHELMREIDAEQPPLTPAQIAFLEQRVKDNEVDPGELLTTEQVTLQLLELKQRRQAKAAARA